MYNISNIKEQSIKISYRKNKNFKVIAFEISIGHLVLIDDKIKESVEKEMIKHQKFDADIVDYQVVTSLGKVFVTVSIALIKKISEV